MRHHPDRPTGDAETFRVLNRAKKVLTSPNLRKQYDLLGLDLHDEEEESNNNHDDDDGGKSGVEEDNSSEDGASADSVMSQIASATLAAVLQVTVRTVMMAVGTTFISRYKITLVPLVLFLLFVANNLRILDSSKVVDIAVPLGLATGVILMHLGRATVPSESDASVYVSTTSTWLFFFGEAIAIATFIKTSVINPTSEISPIVYGVIVVTASVVALILQGRFWRYAFVVAFEAFLALLTVLVFPVLEMLLQEIMNDKLKKVGEKIRAHGKRMEEEIMKARNQAS